MPLFDMPFEQMLTYQGTNPDQKTTRNIGTEPDEMHSLGTDCKLYLLNLVPLT